ncbi:MAG: YgiQ family radical SAM protein [Kiritimatiellae bacterium]|nr:YgiQ family radical SAM protein [Kiritimatiellia bacterium]
MFLPTTQDECRKLGWEALDVILVTGDTYIDSPFIGVAVIGKVLVDAGFRVGIIAQPDVSSADDITRLGEPELFWGVTAGCIDSMVANRTASGRRRKQDDYTPGGVNDRRPDRASIVYSNLVRNHFKATRPIVLGGIEASLRRVAHYDYWSDKIRKSILFDAKADYLLYGMAERAAVELAEALKACTDPTTIRGLCYISRSQPDDVLEVPAFEVVRNDRDAFTEMFHAFYRNNDPATARPLAQRQDTRYLVQNPPALYLSQAELDAIHDIDYERDVHPFYGDAGPVRALDTIRFSIATHRGCYGECNFCAIAVHQGRQVRWRSEDSILKEARAIASHPQFKGTIQDVGGPTANMYGFECTRKMEGQGCCPDMHCLYPQVCAALGIDHGPQLELLRKLRNVPGVKRVVVASGIRHDMVMADEQRGDEYLRTVVKHHVSGRMKIAPEHSEDAVLAQMGKPGRASLQAFRDRFYELTERLGKKQYLTYYFIAAHPGCEEKDMRALRGFCADKLKVKPEQVQVFTPTPSTYSTLMYWTERDPFSGKPCFVEKSVRGRERQKKILYD